MTTNDIGTKHFLKRLMDAYNDSSVGIKSRRLQKLITIEEVAQLLQDYLNTHEDPDLYYYDPVTGEKRKLNYLENITYEIIINPETGEEEISKVVYLNKYHISVNQEMTMETNYPVYKLNYNNDFEINWSPTGSTDEDKDTLDPCIWINVYENSIFNQIPVLIFSKSLVTDINPYDYDSSEEEEKSYINRLHDAILDLSREKQKFINVKWFREYDKNLSEDRVNPTPVYFSYSGIYKMTFLDGKVDMDDIQLFFNKEMKYEFNIKISG